MAAFCVGCPPAFKIGTIKNQDIKMFRFQMGSILERSAFEPPLYLDFSMGSIGCFYLHML